MEPGFSLAAAAPFRFGMLRPGKRWREAAQALALRPAPVSRPGESRCRQGSPSRVAVSRLARSGSSSPLQPLPGLQQQQPAFRVRQWRLPAPRRPWPVTSRPPPPLAAPRRPWPVRRVQEPPLPEPASTAPTVVVATAAAGSSPSPPPDHHRRRRLVAAAGPPSPTPAAGHSAGSYQNPRILLLFRRSEFNVSPISVLSRVSSLKSWDRDRFLLQLRFFGNSLDIERPGHNVEGF